MNLKEIKYAKEQWNAFLERLGVQDEDQLENYVDPASALDLFSLYEAKEYEEFDSVLSGISPRNKYDEKIIPLILKCYREREQSARAFSFLLEAENYHAEASTEPMPDLSEQKRKFKGEELYESVKQSLIHIRSFDADEIPPVIPPVLNKMNDLHGFILVELLDALMLMMKKIVAVESISSENNYNDIVMTILRLRLPLWGWEIADQGRTGKSETKKDAGESDFTITSGGKDKALVEALILKARNFAYLSKHILKCKEYIKYVKHYYIVVYFKGKKKSFESLWIKYQEDVAKIDYPQSWKIDKKAGFKDITAKFGSEGEILVGQTKQGQSSILTHIMINLGTE